MSETDTMAFKFRILRIVSDEARIKREIREAHQLYNDLVAIERKRRDDTRLFWADRGGYADKLAGLRAAAEDAEKAAALTAKGDAGKKERQEIWAPVDTLKREIWELQRKTEEELSDPAKVRRKQRARELQAEAKARAGKALKKEALAALLDAEPDCMSPRDRRRLELVREYEARGVAVSGKAVAQRLRDEGLVGPTEQIEEAARKAGYEAYLKRGVSPGTRAIIADAFERSLEDLEPWATQRFSRWDGHGSFGVQVQGGSLTEEVYSGEHTQVRLRRLEDTGKHREGSRRSGRRHELRVRIGSDGRAPVWAVFEAIVDRPLPPEASIKRVVVTCDRLGVLDIYHVVFTCSVPSSVYHKRSGEQRGTVAVDFGWRSLGGEEMRVGYWVNDRGESGEIRLPGVGVARRGTTGKNSPYEPKIRGQVPIRQLDKHTRDLTEIMAREFAEYDGGKICGGALRDVASWLSANVSIVPEWLTERTTGIHVWRSQHRLYWLAQDWKAQRFDGDAEIFERLSAWASDWAHLAEWERRQHAAILAARNEHYRLVAVGLAKKYERIVINGADFAAAKRRKTKDETDRLVMIDDRSRSQAHLAAAGELREEIVRSAKKWQAIVMKAKPNKATCHACGSTCVYDAAKDLAHECEHCGVRWDQDENCCRNMLCEWSGDGQTAGGARVSPNAKKSGEVLRSKKRDEDGGPIGEAAE